MERLHLCPFLERRDPRCARRLTLVQLTEAFKFCAGCPNACPTHRELTVEMKMPTGRERPARPA